MEEKMVRRRLKLQRFLKPLVRAVFHLFARVRIAGLENLPPRPPYIIFSNHISWFDPPLVGAFMPVPLHIMAMDVLFRFAPLGYIMRRLGAFPVKRGAIDRHAVEYAMELLAKGGVVCIFPEGGIRRLIRGERLRKGISLIAQRARVPLVPMGLSGCRDLYRLWKLLLRQAVIRIRIGKPFFLSPSSSLPAKKERENSMVRIEKELYSLAAEELTLSR